MGGGGGARGICVNNKKQPNIHGIGVAEIRWKRKKS